MPLRYVHLSKELQVLPVRGGGYAFRLAQDEDGRELPGVTFNDGRNAAQRKLRAGRSARQLKRALKKRTRIRSIPNIRLVGV